MKDKNFIFVNHIKNHLKNNPKIKDKKVYCKICNKDINTIYKEYLEKINLKKFYNCVLYSECKEQKISFKKFIKENINLFASIFWFLVGIIFFMLFLYSFLSFLCL